MLKKLFILILIFVGQISTGQQTSNAAIEAKVENLLKKNDLKGKDRSNESIQWFLERNRSRS
jgi:hypothetical protein